jgi:hypothetical protein
VCVCHDFNASVHDGIVPSCWKIANVVPFPKIHKPKSVQDEIRPISLTTTSSTVFESIAGRWMLSAVAGMFGSRVYGALQSGDPHDLKNGVEISLSFPLSFPSLLLFLP